jgi:organic radical activating enzyme
MNQHFQLNDLPHETEFVNYDEVMLTGGEPLLFPELVIETAKKIRFQSKAKIYLYTAKLDNWMAILSILYFVDGLTVTPHTAKDLEDFVKLNSIMFGMKFEKSLKLNLFSDYNFNLKCNLSLWYVKNKKWLKKIHLPKDEVFRRI